MSSPESFTTTLVVAFIDAYSTEGLYWQPMTIRMEIEEDYRIKMPPAVFDRLMTGIKLLTDDGFYVSLPDFNDACVVMSGGLSSLVLELADAADIAWGLTEGLLLSPPDPNNENPFNDEIIGFISHTLKSEGILVPPDVLKIAGINQEIVSKIRMEFSDDPEMFEMVWQVEQAKTDDINDVVRSRLNALVKQLETLPMKNGSTKQIAKKMAKTLESLNKGD